MIYFVTPQYLIENTSVGNNVDATDLNYAVKTAADTFVRSYLGTYFYNDLLTKFNAQTLTGDEVTLVQDYIKNAVAWRAATEAVMNTTYSVRNKGVQQQSGDFSATPEFRVVPWIYDKTREKADFYDSRLRDYLVDNKNLFPNFTSTLNKDSVIKRQYCGACNCSCVGACNCDWSSKRVDPFQPSILFI